MFRRDGNFMLVKITFISRVFEISFGIDKYEKNIVLWGEIIIENLENLYKRAIEHIISIEFIYHLRAQSEIATYYHDRPSKDVSRESSHYICNVNASMSNHIKTHNRCLSHKCHNLNSKLLCKANCYKLFSWNKVSTYGRCHLLKVFPTLLFVRKNNMKMRV